MEVDKVANVVKVGKRGKSAEEQEEMNTTYSLANVSSSRLGLRRNHMCYYSTYILSEVSVTWADFKQTKQLHLLNNQPYHQQMQMQCTRYTASANLMV